MKFCCEHCGRLLSVAGGQAGTESRCPYCKKTVTIPATMAEEAVAQTGAATDQAVAQPKASPRDPLLFDMPPADVGRTEQTDLEAAEKLRALRSTYLLNEREEPRERPLPWIIDIFLYPLNRLGLLILLLTVGIPFALRPLMILTRDLTVAFPPALFLWVPLMLVHWGALLLFLLYINWYIAECIRDSAAGGIRAVDTTASTPGFPELFGQSVTLLACGAACMGPAILYTRNHDEGPLFWVLYGVGGFLFPMALLAVTLFESLRALNPVLLVTSVLSTLVPYCLLTAFCYGLYLLPPLTIRYLLSESWVFGYLLLLLTLYLSLVLAHLVGRFYWRNQEKLNWDT